MSDGSPAGGDRSRFVALIRELSVPLAPLPSPALPPDFEALVYPGNAKPLDGGIRAVLFDIYGTLFCSAAGDIGTQGEYMRGNLDALALEYAGNCTGEELKDYFRSAVLAQHAARYPQTPYPEIRAEAIWAEFLRSRPNASEDAAERQSLSAELALRYELAVNPVCPMPGAEALIHQLAGSGVVMGLISNAQFFTPLLFDAFFGASPEGLGFDPDLLIYSYQMGEAKPAPSLYIRAVNHLAALGIAPAHCLYVGNDMLNDIYAAAALGFKTLLFAGDRRSLRLREGGRLTEKLRPARIISNLADLPGLLSFDAKPPIIK
jgi:putative hydrolase of the HAD superfamily